MDKMLRMIKIMLLVVLIITAFIAGVGAGTASGAREADQTGAHEVESLDGCQVYVWEHGADAGKVVITTRVENISELQGGILVIREKEAAADE